MKLSSSPQRPAALARARSPITAVLRSPLVSVMCTPRSVDDYLELLDPTWSVHEVRARVVGVVAEAGGATSLRVMPNENWRGFRAGQFVCMSVRIDGVRYTRCFSLSSAPEDGPPLRITIRELPGGRVGTWAARTARPGDVIELSQAQGAFVLPEPVPPKLLFIAGGSGITPIASMMRHLLATGYNGELVCLHYARHEPTLGVEMTALACRHPHVRYVVASTGCGISAAPLVGGHFSVEHLEAVAPDWMNSEWFLCGPAALQHSVAQLANERGIAHRLHIERFVSAVHIPEASESTHHRLTFVRSRRSIDGTASRSLLEQAEAAGLRPAHGCRMGVCHSCKCRKVTGVVRDERTGLLSTEPDEDIQLCVTTPMSDVALEL